MTSAGLWPWAIAAAVVGIVICIVIAVLVLRASRAKMPMVPVTVGTVGTVGTVAPPAADATVLASKPIARDAGITAALSIRGSFAHATRGMRSQTSRASERLAIPWVLSIGEAGAGKSTMLDALTLPRVAGTGHAVDGVDDSVCAWDFFERGIVIDIAGSMVLDPTRPRSDDRAWRAVINQLQHHRPERPLDAIVLAIPAADLVGPERLSREALGNKATHVGDRLAELQHALSLRLPVYVVITKCDVIPGFSAFARTVPEKRLDDMVGWSSPYSVDTAFLPAWVDEAMDSVLREMQQALFAALAREAGTPAEGDDLFVLPQHLGRVRSPLREYLQRIFQPTTYERGAFLRGIYFTGDRNARLLPGDSAALVMTPPPTAPAAIPLIAALVPDPWLASTEFGAALRVETPQVVARTPVFLSDLFAEKIFAERGLAQPGPRVFPSKNKVVARMQIAAAAILLLGPFALYGAANGIRLGPWQISDGVRAHAATIKPLLQNIDVSIREMRSRQRMFHQASNTGVEQNVSVFHLLDDMATMNSSRLWSPLLPGTMVSPLHRDITEVIGLAFQGIILPEFSDRLAYRARRLLAPESTRPVADDARYGVGVSLPQYLVDIQALGTSIDRFKNLAQKDKGELQDLVDIVRFLYGEEMAPDFLQNSGYYGRALAEANTNPVPLDSSARFLALRRAGELSRVSYLALLERLNGAQISDDSASAARDAQSDIQGWLACGRSSTPPDRWSRHCRPFIRRSSSAMIFPIVSVTRWPSTPVNSPGSSFRSTPTRRTRRRR